MTTSRDFENLAVWEKALADVGGSERVRLTYYAPNPAWAGKTLAALEKETGRPAAELVREIVRATRGTSRGEAVVVTAMEERFARVGWRALETGSPALDGALVSFDCRIMHTADFGSHSVFFCEVEAIRQSEARDGLVYFDRAYHGVGDADVVTA